MSVLTKKQILADRTLANLAGVREGTLLSYAELTKATHDYIKKNKLRKGDDFTVRLKPLDEKVVKLVIAKYLEIRRDVKARPTRGAGPDFVFDGEIIETKGGYFNFDRALKQMLDYAPKYKEISFAFPVEAFTAQRIMQLNTLAKVIYKQHSRMLKVICVIPEQPPNTYRVGEHNASTLAYNVAETIGELQIWTYPETEAKAKNYEADRIREIDKLVQAAMMQLTRRAADSRTVTV